jgi:hypothetical protein
MVAQGVLALGIVLAVLLLVVLAVLLPVLVARGRSRGADDGEDARSFLAKQIDAHIETLAHESREAGTDQGIPRPGTDRFGQTIELFIAEVLLPHAERAEPWLRDELREILVLQRDDVYGEVRKRVEAHFRQSSFAE